MKAAKQQQSYARRAALALVLALVWPSCLAAQGELDFLPEEVSSRRSEFHDAPGDKEPLKDPFFPRSRRFATKTVAAVSPQVRPAVPQTDPFAHIVIKGISFSRGRALALINDQQFAEGEEGIIRTKDGEVTLRCKEIKRDAVVIEIKIGDAIVERELRHEGS